MKKIFAVLNTERLKNNDIGFSLLELVIAVGVLLILTLGGLLSYNGIINNARDAAVQKAANEVYETAMARYSAGDNGIPADADDDWNNSASNDNQITTELSDLNNGRYQVKAWYGDTYETSKHHFTLITPENNNGNVSPNPENPDNNFILINCGTAHILLCEYFTADYQYTKDRSTPRVQQLESILAKNEELTPEELSELNVLNEITQKNSQKKSEIESNILDNTQAYEDLVNRSERVNSEEGKSISARVVTLHDEYRTETARLDSENNFINPEKVDELYVQFVNAQAEYVNFICS